MPRIHEAQVELKRTAARRSGSRLTDRQNLRMHSGKRHCGTKAERCASSRAHAGHKAIWQDQADASYGI